MNALSLSTASATARPADRLLGAPARLFLLAPPRRPRIDAIFSEAIVLCMNGGRHPHGHEVQCVAARIWSEIQVGPRKVPWDLIMPGCGRHRRLIAAALAALGVTGSDGKPP
jgi:hypothetical protein